MDIARLTNAVRPVLCLGVHGWVPVRVVEYDRVCPRKVDTETAATSGEDECEDFDVVVETVLGRGVTTFTRSRGEMRGDEGR